MLPIPWGPPLRVSYPCQLHWRTCWGLKCQAWFRSLDTSEGNSPSHGKTEDQSVRRGPHSLILKDSGMPRVEEEMGSLDHPWQCPFKKLLLPSAVKKFGGWNLSLTSSLAPGPESRAAPYSSLEAACLCQPELGSRTCLWKADEKLKWPSAGRLVQNPWQLRSVLCGLHMRDGSVGLHHSP